MSERVAGIEPEELPAPSAELVLWRISVEAFIVMMGRRKSERFLRVMAEKFAGEENLSAVFSIRPNSEQGRVRTARRQAAAIFARYMPIFLARMPRR